MSFTEASPQSLLFLFAHLIQKGNQIRRLITRARSVLGPAHAIQSRAIDIFVLQLLIVAIKSSFPQLPWLLRPENTFLRPGFDQAHITVAEEAV